MAQLHILSGAAAGTVFELGTERVTVGRSAANMICLPDDPVSTYHATFIRDGTGYRLRDLNSSNETYLNGTRIREATLNHGDTIRFGKVKARFEAQVRLASEPAVLPPKPQPIRQVGRLQWVGLVGMLLVGVLIGRLLERRTLPARPEPMMPAAPPQPEPRPAPAPVMVPAETPIAVPSPVQAKPVVVEPEKSEFPPLVMVPVPAEIEPLVQPVVPATNVAVEPVAPAPPRVESPPPPVIVKRPPEIPPPAPGPLPIVPPNPYEVPGGLTPQNQVDQLVFPRLQQLGIPPAAVCSDAVFIRRAYLDVIGSLPPAAEVRAFLDDRNLMKRGVLIDKLLERDEFADYWAMKWSDLLRVKSEFPINLWPNAVQTYHQWIQTCLKENRPYDRFARDLLTSSGSNFRDPPVNFYRAVQSKDPATLAQVVALTFMGTRAENWPKERLAGLTAFFAQVAYKATAEWKEEIVYFDPSKVTNGVTAAMFPDGTTIELPPGKDPRAVFADWLIRPANPWFTRNIVNRVWSWLLGRGIIHEPDDIRPDNPPVIPELLTLLERELIANKYDLKSVYRLILKSRTYQLSAVPRSNDPRAETVFAFYPVRRLEAEVMIDAVNQITGMTEKYSSPIPEPFTFIPEDERSIALADGSISSPFLELFGRSPRTSGLEVERSNRPTAAQQLHLLNSSHIQRKIEQSTKLRAVLQSGKGKTRGVADALYLTILSRYPTDAELKAITAFNRTGDWTQRAGWDLAWALINSAEFQERH